MHQTIRFTVPLALISVVVAVTLVVVSPGLSVILGAKFGESEAVVRWLAPVPVFMSLSQGPANALAGLDRLGVRSVIIGGTALLSLVLYLILIPDFGWRGAAVGTLISEVVYALALWGALCAVHSRLRLSNQ